MNKVTPIKRNRPTHASWRNRHIHASWNDKHFIIVLTVDDHKRIFELNPEEEQFIYEQMTIKRQPFDPLPPAS
jgi:hypothetical protein